MNEFFLGIDVGSISTKGVICDQNTKIIASSYLWTQGNPIDAVRRVCDELSRQTGKINISAQATTGSARKLAAAMLNTNLAKNEITAHALGTMSVYPDTRTILEIGGQDSKIIILQDGIVVDYAMNTLCAAGTGSFLSSQAARLGVAVESFGSLALSSQNPATIAARCTVFAESDLVHKAQMGYEKKDIVAGLCNAVVSNYLNNLAKGKTISSPIVFQGGVSKNEGVVQAFEKALNQRITVDKNGHLFGALGAAIIAKNSQTRNSFNFSLLKKSFETKSAQCKKCDNHCELISVFRDKALIDVWGSRCERFSC